MDSDIIISKLKTYIYAHDYDSFETYCLSGICKNILYKQYLIESFYMCLEYLQNHKINHIQYITLNVSIMELMRFILVQMKFEDLDICERFLEKNETVMIDYITQYSNHSLLTLYSKQILINKEVMKHNLRFYQQIYAKYNDLYEIQINFSDYDLMLNSGLLHEEIIRSLCVKDDIQLLNEKQLKYFITCRRSTTLKILIDLKYVHILNSFLNLDQIKKLPNYVTHNCFACDTIIHETARTLMTQLCSDEIFLSIIKNIYTIYNCMHNNAVFLMKSLHFKQYKIVDWIIEEKIDFSIVTVNPGTHYFSGYNNNFLGDKTYDPDINISLYTSYPKLPFHESIINNPKGEDLLQTVLCRSYTIEDVRYLVCSKKLLVKNMHLEIIWRDGLTIDIKTFLLLLNKLYNNDQQQSLDLQMLIKDTNQTILVTENMFPILYKYPKLIPIIIDYVGVVITNYNVPKIRDFTFKVTEFLKFADSRLLIIKGQSYLKQYEIWKQNTMNGLYLYIPNTQICKAIALAL